jgi:heavy metal translocating P-type ATPase
VNRLWKFAREYPAVVLTVGITVVAGALNFASLGEVARWGVTAYGIVIAGLELRGMIRELKQGKLGIDVLALIAILATLAVGEYWATLMIVFMLSGGQALEVYAAGRAKRELSALLVRAPQRAHRLVGAKGETEDVPVGEVAIGDRLVVRSAEIIPVDGTLASAHGSFDESSLTGESLPVDRVRGEGVLSGALNGQTAVEITATVLAEDSSYQRIVALVAEASESKAPLVRVADRYAVPFTIFSLAVAGVAWLVSGDPIRFVEVLVVATPCPLLLAAPVAFMGGMSRAARHGIIVKGAGTLEKLSRAKTVAFDKTGTLTAGKPTVASVSATADFSADELLSLAAAAEQYSSHVLAASIVNAARERGLDVPRAEDAREEEAHGVVATVGGRTVVVGKLGFIATHAADAEAITLAGGQLSVYVSVDGAFAGAIILSDAVRNDAERTLSELAALGITRTLMLTGDAEVTAHHIGTGLGIATVHHSLLPADKVRIIRSLTERPVVMVGDGVNDAPVLAVADIGIAMGARGATAASESADVVILIDDLSRTAEAIRVGKRTMMVALQSIWLGIGLSVLLMAVAAGGFLPAIIGAALQEIVDLATILNSLRALSDGGRPRASHSPGGRESVAGEVVGGHSAHAQGS